MNARALGLVLLLLVVIPAAGHTEPLSENATTDLLKKMTDSRAGIVGVRKDFVETKTSRLSVRPIQSKGTLFLAPPDRFRREVAGSNPSITICNGETLWVYYPSFAEAEQYDLARQRRIREGLSVLSATMNFVRLREDFEVSAEKGRDSWKLTLRPRNRAIQELFKQLVVELDEDLRVTRTDFLSPNGDRTVTIFTDERSAPLPPETFDFQPPAGVRVTRPLG